MFLKNFVANKISIKTVNDDQRDFVFNLMKGYNVNSFFKKCGIKDLDNRNLYEKSKRKALDILLECEKSTEGIKKFFPKNSKKYINENQKSILLNAMMLFDIRNAIVGLFKNGFIKPLRYQSTKKPKSEESIAEITKLRGRRLDEIAQKKKRIDFNLFNYYFKYSSPSDMYKGLNKADTESNKVKVDFIKDDMINFKKDIENASKDDVDKIEKMNKIANIAERILYFNNENQEGSGLKILTTNQMLSRLPITLAQLKAGNNSEKLKNEIRQLLYSLYRSKKLTKTVYNNLIIII